jgi:hypothetical protein
MIENELLSRAAAGAAGSGLAVWMAKVTGVDLIVMFLGGFASAWFLGEPVAEFFNLVKHEAAVGFAVGFLSILVLRKLYESIQSIEAGGVGKALVDKFRKMLGV